MVREKNMAETFKFVYVLILFISICFVITISDSLNLADYSCIKDKDCPKVKSFNIRCRKGFCVNIL